MYLTELQIFDDVSILSVILGMDVKHTRESFTTWMHLGKKESELNAALKDDSTWATNKVLSRESIKKNQAILYLSYLSLS